MTKVVPAGKKIGLRRGIDHIGVSVAFVVHDGQGHFLMHKRSQNCRDEQGTWDNGGGAVEFGESLEAAVRREVEEEYGAKIQDVAFLAAYDVHRLIKGKPTHWVALTHSVKIDRKTAKNNEPEKIDEIGWFTSNRLPKPLHSQSLRDIKLAKAAGIIR